MMKNKRGAAAGAVILSIVLVVLIAAGAFYYFKVYQPSVDRAAAESTSYSINGRGPQKSGERTLVAENDGISVYKDGDYVIIDNDGAQAEFTDWDENFGSIDTNVYYSDFDNDGNNDIIILDNEGRSGSPEVETFGFYLLTAAENGSDEPYSVYYTNGENWLATFNEIVTCYLSQPQAYPNLLQFVMDYSTTEVQFDSDTGLALPEFRAYYTDAPETDNSNYAALDSMRLSPAVIDYDENTGTAEAQIYVYASYTNANEQNIGTIHVGIELYEGSLIIRGRSVTFTPNSELEAAAPQR